MAGRGDHRGGVTNRCVPPPVAAIMVERDPEREPG
jgi:hypothetical protein